MTPTDPAAAPGPPWRVAGAVAALIAAAACVALGLLYLDARQSLHDFFETRHPSGTMHLHYALMRRLVLLAVAGAVVAAVGACATVRRRQLVAVLVLLATSVGLVVFGLQQSPAAFVRPPSGADTTFAVGKGDLYPEPERREFHLAALLALVSAATLAVGALTTVASLANESAGPVRRRV